MMAHGVVSAPPTARGRQPAAPQIAELQGATAHRSSSGWVGGQVWVLGLHLSSGTAGPLVRLAPMKSNLTVGKGLRVEHQINDSVLLVSLPPRLPEGGPWRLAVETAGGQAFSPPVNAPEVHWADPYARAGDVIGLCGRRLYAPAQAKLRCASNDYTVPLWHENSNRATFRVPLTVQPGLCRVSYLDSAGEWLGATSGGPSAAVELEVLPALVIGSVLNASRPPYSADSSGRTDATHAILRALTDATEGGTVHLGPGLYRLNPPNQTAHPQPAGCRSYGGVAICAPFKRVSIVGAGMNSTVLLMGPTCEVAIWGSPISLSDLTLSDRLPLGEVTNATGYQPGLVSMDTWAAWQYNISDVSFRRVHFVGTRTDVAIFMRYARRIVVDSCLMEGGAVVITAGPLRDIQITNNIARLQGNDAKKLGGGVGAFVGGPVGGRVSSMTVVNNTLGALLPLTESDISGRVMSVNGFFEYLYVANNINERAGPGDKNPDMNQGEQILWETGNEYAIPEHDQGVKVARVLGNRLTLDHMANTTVQILLMKFRCPGSLPKSYDGSGGMVAKGWDARYGVNYGGVTIVAGRGMGQTRLLRGFEPDNRTVVLDAPFTVEPDQESQLILFGTTVHSVIIRDITFRGIPKHVDQVAHTATVMVPLWGRAHRVEYANLVARDMRDTLYSMVDGPGGLSVTDHIVRDIVSIHTRTGIALTPAPTATHHLSLLISMSNITLRNVTGTALSIETATLPNLGGVDDGLPGAPNASNTAGGLTIDRLLVSHAKVGLEAFTGLRFGWTFPSPYGTHVNFSGTGLGAFVLRDALFDGGTTGQSTAVWRRNPFPVAHFSNVSFVNFRFPRNGSSEALPYIPYSHTVMTKRGGVWFAEVPIENVGLGSGTFVLRSQSETLQPNGPSSWDFPPSSSMVLPVSVASDNGGCAYVCRDDDTTVNASFCVVPPAHLSA